MTLSTTGDYVPLQFGICVSSCPEEGESRSDPYGEYGSWESVVDTIDALNYCVPYNEQVTSSFFSDVFGKYYYYFIFITSCVCVCVCMESSK